MSTAKNIDPVAVKMLENFNKENSQSKGVLYLKDGEISVKLVIPEGKTEDEFWKSFKTTWEKKQYTYMLIACVVVGADDESIVDPNSVRYVKVPPSVIQQIIGIRAKRWKIFDPNSPCVDIRRIKKGGTTSYTANISTETFSLTDSIVYPTYTIDEAAAEQEQMSIAKNSNSTVAEVF